MADRVQKIWCQVLGLESVMDGDFFDIGGDSYLVTVLLSRLYDEAGVSVPAREFYSDPSLTGLCQLVAAATEHDPQDERGQL